jgi:hypothetical protein
MNGAEASPHRSAQAAIAEKHKGIVDGQLVDDEPGGRGGDSPHCAQSTFRRPPGAGHGQVHAYLPE